MYLLIYRIVVNDRHVQQVRGFDRAVLSASLSTMDETYHDKSTGLLLKAVQQILLRYQMKVFIQWSTE